MWAMILGDHSTSSTLDMHDYSVQQAVRCAINVRGGFGNVRFSRAVCCACATVVYSALCDRLCDARALHDSVVW